MLTKLNFIAAAALLMIATAPAQSQDVAAGNGPGHDSEDRQIAILPPLINQPYNGYYQYPSDWARYRYRYYRRHGYYPDYYPYQRYRYDRRNNDAAIVTGIIGSVMGSVIANSRARYNPYNRQYRGAWVGTRAWYDYCRRKYRSFDARSGTYMTYRGVRRACR